MRKILILSVLSLSLSAIIFMAMPAFATSSQDPAGTADPSVVRLDNPLYNAGISTPQQLIGKVISAILGVIGSIALLMFVYGGFVWMTAAGNEKKVSQGRDILMWAAIGLIIIFISYAAVRFLIGEVIGV